MLTAMHEDKGKYFIFKDSWVYKGVSFDVFLLLFFFPLSGSL